MGQRSKVLDTEGPTPRFLYAILKQLKSHLKDIDWNHVASDLEISNGHAARMRYSRFVSQIDPNTKRPSKKKNTKKDAKGDLKGDIQPSQTMPQQPFPEAGIMPKLEVASSQYQSDLIGNSYTFVKYETGNSTAHMDDMQGPSNPQDNPYHSFVPFHISPTTTMPSPQMMPSPSVTPSPSTMPSPQMMPPRYIQPYQQSLHGTQPQQTFTGMPLSLTSGMYSPLPVSNPSAFTSYPSSQMVQDLNMHDFPSQTPGFNTGPVLTWEPVPQQQSESAPSPTEKIKEESESCERKGEAVVIKAEEDTVDKICIDLQEA